MRRIQEGRGRGRSRSQNESNERVERGDEKDRKEFWLEEDGGSHLLATMTRDGPKVSWPSNEDSYIRSDTPC